MVDRWGWAIQTSIPAVLDYPVRSVTQSWCALPASLSVSCLLRGVSSPRFHQGLHQRFGRVPVRRWMAYEDRCPREAYPREREVIVRGLLRGSSVRDLGSSLQLVLRLVCECTDDLITTGWDFQLEGRRRADSVAQILAPWLAVRRG